MVKSREVLSDEEVPNKRLRSKKHILSDTDDADDDEGVRSVVQEEQEKKLKRKSNADAVHENEAFDESGQEDEGPKELEQEEGAVAFEESDEGSEDLAQEQESKRRTRQKKIVIDIDEALEPQEPQEPQKRHRVRRC
jgi:hypothetical protein